jgi:hypothetical protein
VKTINFASWPNLAYFTGNISWMDSVSSLMLVIHSLKHSAQVGINLECILEVLYKWKYVVEFCRALVIYFVIVVGKLQKIPKLLQTCNTQILEQTIKLGYRPTDASVGL